MKPAFLALLLITTVTSPAHADEPAPAPSPSAPPSPSSCLSLQDLEEAKTILAGFQFRSWDPAFKIDFCDANNLFRNTTAAILLLKNLPNVSDSANPFDNEKLSPNPWAFFSSRINDIVFETDASYDGFCGKNPGVIAFVAGAQDGIMHICPSAAAQDIFTLSAILVHESRHQDGFPHVNCQHGDYATEAVPACDTNYKEAGSYGIQTEYYVKVSKANGVDPAIRQEARSSALLYFMQRFNQLPLGIKNGAVLADNSETVNFYDGKSLTPMFQAPSAEFELTSMDDNLALIQPKEPKIQLISEDGTTMGESLAENNGADLLDVYQDISGFCLLFPNGIVCASGDANSKPVTIKFNDFTAIGFASHDVNYFKENIMYIASTTGDVYYLPLNLSQLSAMADKPLPHSKDFSGLINFAKLDSSHMMILNAEGQAELVTLPPSGYESVSSSSKKTPAPGIDPSRRFTRMFAPYYWSQELKDL